MGKPPNRGHLFLFKNIDKQQKRNALYVSTHDDDLMTMGATIELEELDDTDENNNDIDEPKEKETSTFHIMSLRDILAAVKNLG